MIPASLLDLLSPEMNTLTSSMVLALRLLGVAGLALGVHLWRRKRKGGAGPSAESEPLLEEASSPRAEKPPAPVGGGKEAASTAAAPSSAAAEAVATEPQAHSEAPAAAASVPPPVAVPEEAPPVPAAVERQPALPSLSEQEELPEQQQRQQQQAREPAAASEPGPLPGLPGAAAVPAAAAAAAALLAPRAVPAGREGEEAGPSAPGSLGPALLLEASAAAAAEESQTRGAAPKAVPAEEASGATAAEAPGPARPGEAAEEEAGGRESSLGVTGWAAGSPAQDKEEQAGEGQPAVAEAAAAAETAAAAAVGAGTGPEPAEPAAGLATPSGKAAAAPAGEGSPPGSAPSPAGEPSRDSDVSLADGLGEGPLALAAQHSAEQEALLLAAAAPGGGGGGSGGRMQLEGEGSGGSPRLLFAMPLARAAAATSAFSEPPGALQSEPSSSETQLSSRGGWAAAAAPDAAGEPEVLGTGTPPRAPSPEQPFYTEPSLALGMGAAGTLAAAAAAAAGGAAAWGEPAPQPCRLSLSDWVPPGTAPEPSLSAAAQQAPLALGSPFPAGGLQSPPRNLALPAWPGPGAGAGPHLSAAAALESSGGGGGSPRGGEAAAEAAAGYAPPDFTLASPSKASSAGGLDFGPGRPPLRLDRSTGTRKSLLPAAGPLSGPSSQPGSPVSLSPSALGGGAGGGGGGGGLFHREGRAPPLSLFTSQGAQSPPRPASPHQHQQQQPAQHSPRACTFPYSPTASSDHHHPFSLAHQLPQQQQQQAGGVGAGAGGLHIRLQPPSIASPRSPFHSPREGQSSAAGSSGAPPSQLPFSQLFATHAAERPHASPAASPSSAAASSSGRAGRRGGGQATNPFAWGGQQQHQAQEHHPPTWEEFGVGLRLPQQQQQHGGVAWSAEERLSSSSSQRGGEKRLRVNELGVQWAAPAGPPQDVPRLALQLLVIAGPCAEAGTTYVTEDDTTEVVIGRSPGCTMQLNDAEVSGRHLLIHWNSQDKVWQVADLGSLNGTLLNGEPISQARKRGRDYRLSSDDILQLGTYTKVKVSTFPREMLDTSDRHGSLPVGSLPKSLSVPKHRIPSFTSLLSPKISSTPSKKDTVAAASDELRLECCIVSRTGRDHMRKGQVSEDVASAACPLPCGDAALPPGTSPSLFCVFDGHCGRGAAEESNTLLPDEVAARLAGHAEQLSKAQGVAAELRQAFLTTDDRLKSEEGCTATAVLAWRDAEGAVCLQAANVGDSAALFIDPATGACSALTEDHRLSNPSERERLQKMGIQVTQDTRRLYGLNLARGLGDKFLKDEDLGLSAEPFVSHVLRVPPGQGGLLLIASDGLWDFADAETVTQLALASDRDSDGSVLEVAAAVIGHAVKQRTRDDVTVLVARIWPEEEWELRSPMKNLDDGAAVSFVSS